MLRTIIPTVALLIATVLIPSGHVHAATRAPQILQDFESFSSDQDFYGYFAVKYVATFKMNLTRHIPATKKAWMLIVPGDTAGGGYHVQSPSSWNVTGYDSLKFWVDPGKRAAGIVRNITVGLREAPVATGEYWVAWVPLDPRFPTPRWYGISFKRFTLRTTEQQDSILNGTIEELACVVDGSRWNGTDTVVVDDFQFVAAAPKTGVAPARPPLHLGSFEPGAHTLIPHHRRESPSAPCRLVDWTGRIVERGTSLAPGIYTASPR